MITSVELLKSIIDGLDANDIVGYIGSPSSEADCNRAQDIVDAANGTDENGCPEDNAAQWLDYLVDGYSVDDLIDMFGCTEEEAELAIGWGE